MAVPDRPSLVISRSDGASGHLDALTVCGCFHTFAGTVNTVLAAWTLMLLEFATQLAAAGPRLMWSEVDGRSAHQLGQPCADRLDTANHIGALR